MLPGLPSEPSHSGDATCSGCQVDTLLELAGHLLGAQPDLGGDGLGGRGGVVVNELERAGLVLDARVDHLGVRVGELVGYRAEVEVGLPSMASWRLVIRSLPVLRSLIERGEPGVGGVDVAAVPRRQDRLRLQVDELNIAGETTRSGSARPADCSARSTRTG